MALSARVPKTPLSRLVAILAIIVVADLLIAAAVFVDRLDDPRVPDFRRDRVADIRWDISPYRDAPAVLGFPTRLREPDGSGPPEVDIRYAISALARYEKTRETGWLGRARRALERVLDQTESGLVAHRSRTTDLLGRPVKAPWYAADTQGMFLSALARYEEVTRDRRWRGQAHDAFAALGSFQGFFAGSRPAPQHWLSSVDRQGHLWFDRFSTGLSSTRVLSEQLWTALGVYDYRRVMATRPADRRQATDLLRGALRTIEDNLPRWRVPGKISIASLQVGNHDVRSHFVVATQLAILDRITSAAWVARAARQYELDDNLPYFALGTVSAVADFDAYSRNPQDLVTLARSGRPLRLARPADSRSRGGTTDPLSRAAQALVLLSDPAATIAEVQRAGDLVSQVMSDEKEGLVPHRLPLEDTNGRAVKGTWYSASTQGLMLSTLTRLSERTGQPQWRRDADRLYEGLTRVRDYGQPTTKPWLALIDFSGYLWFDQNLGASPPPRSIYEHATALVGLYDYWRLTERDEAFTYFAGGVTTLRDAISYIRRRDAPAVESLATGASDRGYHGPITYQVESLATITEDPKLMRFARQLRKDYP